MTTNDTTTEQMLAALEPDQRELVLRMARAFVAGTLDGAEVLRERQRVTAGELSNDEWLAWVASRTA